MDIKKIKYFIAVAEELHFGRAAQRLFISQPPLSFHIKALEEELGVQLFVRDRHSVRLTEAGTVFLEHARAIMRMVPIAIEATRRAAQSAHGLLQIGYSGSAMFSDNILGCIANYRREHPAVEVGLYEGPTHTHIDHVRQGRCDVALVRGPLPPPVEGLNVQLIKRERLVVVVPLGHRLAQQPHVWLSELSNERFVVFQKIVGAALNQLLGGLFSQAGIEPTVSIEATGMLSVLGLVGIGTGISILPESVTSLNYPNVACIQLADGNAQTELYVVTPLQPSATARAFVAALHDHRATANHPPVQSVGTTVLTRGVNASHVPSPPLDDSRCLQAA